jgi:cytochrome P450
MRARQGIDEALRLYPPAYGLTRQALEEDEVGGYRIKKGTQILLSTYAMHRHPGFWEEPDRFDPGRFSVARSEGRPRYAYFPFGGGQRICIGQAFASMELAIFVPAMLSAFRFALAEEADCTPQPRMTLRPRGPMWMRLSPR